MRCQAFHRPTVQESPFARYCECFRQIQRGIPTSYQDAVSTPAREALGSIVGNRLSLAHRGAPQAAISVSDSISTISKASLEEYIATLSRERIRAVNAAIRYALGLEG